MIGEGPTLSVQPVGPKGKRLVLRCRLFFDPSDVGLSTPEAWMTPPATAVELGARDKSGVTAAGIDYLRSDKATVAAWSAAVADPAEARDLGGRAPFGIASSRDPLPADVAARARVSIRTAAAQLVR